MNKGETSDYLQRLPGKRGWRKDKLQAKANQVPERFPCHNAEKRRKDVVLANDVYLDLEVLDWAGGQKQRAHHMIERRPVNTIFGSDRVHRTAGNQLNEGVWVVHV